MISVLSSTFFIETLFCIDVSDMKEINKEITQNFVFDFFSKADVKSFDNFLKNQLDQTYLEAFFYFFRVMNDHLRLLIENYLIGKLS